MRKIFSFLLLIGLSATGMANPNKIDNNPETVTVQGHYFDDAGELICEGDYPKCKSWDPRVVVYTYGTKVRTEDLEQFNQLEQDFVREAVRQYQISQKLTPEQYYENLQKAEFSEWRCWFNGLLTCKLGEIAAQRNALGYDTGGWYLKGGYVNRNIETPLQAERFGPYKGKAKRKLARLQKEFAVECIRQQLIGQEKARQSHKLRETVLKASSVMVRSLSTEKRRSLFEEWQARCGKDDERPEDATIRFLLSGQTRRFNSYDGVHYGEGVWMCLNIRPYLNTTDECGTVRFWHSEEKHINVISELRGLVPTLTVAKSK